MTKIITLTNIMANGGQGFFGAFLSNCTWQSSTQTAGDGATKSVRVIPSAAGECTLASSVAHSLIASHKYYLSFKIKFESQASGTADWYWPVAEPAAVSGMNVSGDANTWIHCSAVFDRTSFSNGSYPCRFDYNNESVNVPFRFTSCMLFDLTTAFGAGNEPSKEWMDTHITSFGDSLTVHYMEEVRIFNEFGNKMSDEDYENNEQRKSGLKGLASSELFNKILYQTTSMSNALFKFIKEKSKVDIEDLSQLKNILDNIYSNAVDIKIKREAQGKFRYDILRANINDKANKHALMINITESEKQRSYGLGYALALYGGMRDGYDFEILFNLDTLDQIKNSNEAMAIINKVMILKDLWDKYIS